MVFVPFITKRDPRGGGGGGRGGGSSSGGRSGGTSSSSGGSRSGSGSSSSSGGSRSSGSSSGSSSRGSTGGGSSSAGRSSSVSTGTGSQSASSRGFGGGTPVTIPAGQPFAGRQAGGATRSNIYGNQQYGSGYPGIAGRGVAGRGFPFYFWPLAWGGAAGVGTGAYLHSREYGDSNNSSRPGGAMVTAAFSPRDNSTQTYRLVADNTTVTSLIDDIRASCSDFLSSNSSTAPAAFDPNGSPKPEQTIQYYRASSVALTFDDYNNTGALAAEGTPDSPLPSSLNATFFGTVVVA
ncbi:hypothetical protein ONZ45_g7091 [Pleurotus djamor]|nr:hypothetical protein ONZ45_g7091 [Pleurotus djamor]